MHMRASYPGYKRLTQREIESLWEECVFTFDASALLDLYRVTPDVREIVLNTLERLKERLWIPHQAGLEYHDNRIQVIATGLGSYSRIPELARSLLKEYRKTLDNYRQYRWIETEKWAGLLDEAAKKIEDTISKQTRVLDGFIEKDPVEERLNAIFHERVGPPLKEMHEIYVRADQRLQLSIPPGFKDAAEKKDFHRYGDIVFWFQLLDYAKEEKKSIVLATSDSKTDWWLKRDGKTIGARPELLQEMHAVAGVKFHMYPLDRFVEYAQKHLESNLKPAVLKKTVEQLRAIEVGKQLAEEQTSRNVAFERALGFSVDDYTRIDAALKDWSPSSDLMKSIAAAQKDFAVNDFMKTIAAAKDSPSSDLMRSIAAIPPGRAISDSTAEAEVAKPTEKDKPK